MTLDLTALTPSTSLLLPPPAFVVDALPDCTTAAAAAVARLRVSPRLRPDGGWLEGSCRASPCIADVLCAPAGLSRVRIRWWTRLRPNSRFRMLIAKGNGKTLSMPEKPAKDVHRQETGRRDERNV